MHTPYCTSLFVLLAVAAPAFCQTDSERIAELVRELDSNRFQARTNAEQELTAFGKSLALRAIKQSLGEVRTKSNSEVAEILAGGRKPLDDVLQSQLFGPLGKIPSREVRMRTARIRLKVEPFALQKWDEAIRGISPVIPKEIAKEMHGVTGGFRAGTTFFDATYQNGTKYTITSVRILVRLISRNGNDTREKLVYLDMPGSLVAPGQQVRLSCDTGMRKANGLTYYWKTVEVRGFLKP